MGELDRRDYEIMLGYPSVKKKLKRIIEENPELSLRGAIDLLTEGNKDLIFKNCGDLEYDGTPTRIQYCVGRFKKKRDRDSAFREDYINAQIENAGRKVFGIGKGIGEEDYHTEDNRIALKLYEGMRIALQNS